MNRHPVLRFSVCIAIAFASSIAFAQFLPGGGVNTSSPSLPPLNYPYVKVTEPFATYLNGPLTVVLSGVQLTPTSSNPPVYGGGNETDHFFLSMSGQMSVNGSPSQPTSASGTGDEIELAKGPGNVTGTYNTEMLALNLSGSSLFGPYLLRESPTLPSAGETRITDIGGGQFHIDSFFDVFTELSVDGGASWIPSTGSSHVDLNPAPEPAAAALLALGLTGLVGLVRRRR